MASEFTILFDDFNEIICECSIMYHPAQEMKHLNSAKHKKLILKKTLTAADKKLMKKFKKLMYTPEAVV